MATAIIKIQERRDTEANWTSVNPVLLSGEIGYCTDGLYFKVGNGVDNWTSLTTTNEYRPYSDVVALFNLYESLTQVQYLAKSDASELVAGKTYAITDAVPSIGLDWLLLIKATDETGYNSNVVVGELIYLNVSTNKIAVWDVTWNRGVFLSLYNRALDIRFTSITTFTLFFVGVPFDMIANGDVTKCDFSNYSGTLNLGAGTVLRGCDFSDSTANFDTLELTVAATFSGRILHDFIIPDQTTFPCDFTNVIQINADGTNNMMATITLAAAQSTLDYTGFESASIVKLVPDAGTNNIDTITNTVIGREYKIVSDDTSGLLSISTGVAIIFNSITNAATTGLVVWNTPESVHNEVCFFTNATESLVTVNSNLYL